jgi:2'-5' RNA ligase
MIKKYHRFLEMSNNRMKRHTGTDYKFGCVMANLNIPNWDEITSHINIDDLYKPEEDRYGIESDPHITILYGLHNNVKDSEVEKIIKSVNGDNITIDIKGIDIFENEEFDVVKMSVQSEYLTKLHYELYKLPNSDRFSKYNAHITIAYVKKGEGSKYRRSSYSHHIDGIHDIIYSKPDGNKIKWSI